LPSPPQTIIFDPVQTAEWKRRAEAAFAVDVAVHVSVAGSYIPPVFRTLDKSYPPQTTIFDPVQTAECWKRTEGAFVVDVVVQVSVAGS
jgi:hypothetical protein